jgi:hypothetical protein
MDNLNIKGIRDDEPHVRGRIRPRGKKRKPFVIESRIVYPDDIPRHSIFPALGLNDWSVHCRYHTESARDQAYAAMVKKENTARIPRWGYWEFRKRDD